MHRIRRWLALPSSQRALAWRALGVVVVVRLLLTLPFGLWTRAVALLRGVTHRLPQGARSRGDVAWAVSRVSALVPGATCLTQALATALLLPRGDPAAVLRFGVHRSATGAVEGHAWLESAEGVLIGGEDLERYAPLGSWRIAHADRPTHPGPRTARG